MDPIQLSLYRTDNDAGPAFYRIRLRTEGSFLDVWYAHLFYICAVYHMTAADLNLLDMLRNNETFLLDQEQE